MRKWFLIAAIFIFGFVRAQDSNEMFKHGYAVGEDGVKIHYASLGVKGEPLMLFIHGFPDFWYTWSDLMKSFSSGYYNVAIDQRGYNLSDKPREEEAYRMPKLAGDVVAVIHSLGYEKAIIVGHDWGGAVAWEVAIQHPEVVDRLIVLNLPHFNGLRRELATNPDQQKASEYARNFQSDLDICKKLSAKFLAYMVVGNSNDSVKLKRYTDAMSRSDCEAMMSYYRQNYPSEPYTDYRQIELKAEVPVLLIFGLQDRFLLADALNNTWDWIDNDLTIVTIPNAGHFVHHEKPDKIIAYIRFWMKSTN